ncbi:MAG: hypothetical protein ACE5FU_00085 [Nitrospinota bacterium]
MAPRKIVVDTHTHIYSCFDLEIFFESAVKNLGELHRPEFEEVSSIKCIVLTEGVGCDFFSSFINLGKFGKNGRYSFEKNEEGVALLLKDRSSALCYVIPGKQIVTEERVEVLTLGSWESVADGLDIRALLDRLLKKEIMTVLPWGAGKWFGRRKRVLMEVLHSFRSPCLFLADNSGRPSFWGVPEILRIADSQGFTVLNGSDPFSLPGDNGRAGSAGVVVEGEWHEQFPVQSLRAQLLKKDKKIRCVGKRDGIAAFLRRQGGLYIKKLYQ